MRIRIRLDFFFLFSGKYCINLQKNHEQKALDVQSWITRLELIPVISSPVGSFKIVWMATLCASQDSIV